jgi:cytochrome c peroxidase
MQWTGSSSARLSGACLLLTALVAGCGTNSDGLCGDGACEFTSTQWSALKKLAGLPDPPPDASNKYVGRVTAEALGQKFYFDARFSGNATQLDMLRRTTQYARAAVDQPINISCATCHNPARAGSDFTSIPGHVSVGAGWYDVNGQQTVNAAYYDLIYWNGRSDSLWAQIMAVNESFVSMNSNRLKNAWLIQEKYKAEYEGVFVDYPLPLTGAVTDLPPTNPKFSSGTTPHPQQYQCVLDTGSVCPSTCRSQTTVAGGTSCWPRFPAQGKPGSKTGCNASDPTEPFGDAWDCMAAADKTLINRVFANFAKSIATYEYKLISRNSDFDKFMGEGPKSALLSDAAKRGAALFVGKASCVECHSTSFFSDNGFHNVGVPQVGAAVPTEMDCPENNGPCDCVKGVSCLPWGVWDGIKKLKGQTTSRRDQSLSDDTTDITRKKFTDLELTDNLKGTWRTPSLRDVALTAPYMHNGALRTLEEVVWHYNIGGASAGYPGDKAVQIRPLGLTDQEQADLVAFLQTLNGEPLPKELTVSPPLP